MAGRQWAAPHNYLPPRTRQMAKINVEFQKKWANDLLASAISQKAKKTITVMIETLLMEANMYRGFNHNYWITQGCDEWYDNGKPEFPEKNEFIRGREGNANRENDDWVGDIQGEYSRTYH